MRLIPGSTGSAVPPQDFRASNVRRHIDGDDWDPWETAVPTEIGSALDTGILSVRGSRQVLEIEYEVADRTWDGVLGIEVTYESEGNYEHAYVNSKVFISPPRTRRPLTFWFRAVQRAKVLKRSITE